MFESILFLLLSLSILLIAFILDESDNKVAFYVSSPFFLFLSFFPIYFNAGLGDKWLVLDSFGLNASSWTWLIIIMINYFLVFLISPLFKKSTAKHSPILFLKKYDMRKLDLFFYLFSFLSLIAFIVNFNRVGFSVSELFINPRKYEKTFGMFWYINYLYFLHVPALIILAIKVHMKNVCSVDLFLSLLVFICTFFHGIKYTVFDAIFFPLLFYICLVGFNKVRIKFLFLCAFFVVFFSIFSFYVRGGYGDFDPLIIFTYILPNYYNLFYSLELKPFPMVLPHNALLGFLPETDLESFLLGGFILNPKYNMSTGLKELIEVFSIFCILGFYLPALVYLKKYKRNSILHIFVATYVLFCFLMMFYSYYFGTKFKYIYFLIIFIIIDFFSKRKISD